MGDLSNHGEEEFHGYVENYGNSLNVPGMGKRQGSKRKLSSSGVNRLVGDLKTIEKYGHRGENHDDEGLGERLRRGIIDKVHEEKAKAKIDEAVIRPDQSKEVKVY
jgi:hypothetical protein